MRTFSIHQIRNLFLAALFVTVLGAVYFVNSSLLMSPTAEAGTGQNVSGWAWADSVGWISLNSTSDGSATSYGVNIDATNKATGGTGDFSGAAWSENTGWISFDRSLTGNPPSSPFATGSGAIAQVDWSTGKVTGWAKVLNATTWDGWIKLSDDSVPSWSGKGLTISGNKFSGYGYGSGNGTGTDGAIGWIDFAPTINGVPVNAQISAPPCVATMGYNLSDPNMIWGSCQPISACTAAQAGTTLYNQPGVAVGSCTSGGVPTGGTTVVSCGNNATLVCPGTAVSTSTKTHWWQF